MRVFYSIALSSNIPSCYGYRLAINWCHRISVVTDEVSDKPMSL